MSNSISAKLRAAFARHAADNRTALFEAASSMSYTELAALVDHYASGFHQWGLTRGEMVGFVVAKSSAAICAYFGAMQAGGCVCFIEPQLAPEAIFAQMKAVGMTRLVVDGGLLAAFEGATGKAGEIRALDSLQGDGAYADENLGPGDRAMLLFTSGSTGAPKGVLLTHAGLVCNAEGVLRHTNIRPEDRLLHVMPIYHTNGVNNQLITPFLSGAGIILVERFRAEETMDMLRQGTISYMTGVPTMYSRMLPFVKPGERFASLRFLRCGSAPITPALHGQIEEAFGVPLIVSYGLSEATCTSTMNPVERRKIGTIGTVLAGQDVRLFDPSSGLEAPSGAEGEIRISGPSLMVGYLGDGVEQPIHDGWLRTGDLGMFDEDGFLTITGRIKDVIIRGGENISPALIERQLATHPAIRDCCVVGAPDRDLGEVPVAFVAFREGQSAADTELKDFVKGLLARIYVPAEIHVVESLPTNSVGKVDRKALRKILAASLVHA